MSPALPLQIHLEIAIFLEVEDQLSYLRAFPQLARLFGPRHFAPKGKFRDNILHCITETHTADLALDTAIFTDLIACSGANLHIQNRFNYTPLNNAIGASNYTFAKLILDKDPSGINLKDEQGRSALHRAVEEDFISGLALLLAQPGIDPNLTNEEDQNMTALIKCLRGNFNKGAELLIALENIDLNHVDGYSHTALFYAAGWGKEDLVRRMLGRTDLEVELDVNQEDSLGHTALYHAAVENHVGIVDMLLDTGRIRVHWEDGGYKNPLHPAARTGAVEALERLLGCEGVRVNAVDGSGHTAYQYADDERCRRLLLDHGAVPGPSAYCLHPRINTV
ncbi:ankyrin repeat-containing domain protein [Aspergillus multicolor]|uniref:ankyrin repeat domain-containing protein n=1 Tax=Aspergillus multicolor TaxID=41759 RepID=UPI003CCD76AC